MIDPEAYPVFDFNIDLWHELQYYVDDQECWYAKTLWEAAKDLPIYEVPLVAMDCRHQPWDDVGTDFKTFCKHCKLVMDADLSYPIILEPGGQLVDGRHRLAKALITGQSTIKIQRLTEMPEPDFVFDEDGCILKEDEDDNN